MPIALHARSDSQGKDWALQQQSRQALVRQADDSLLRHVQE